jgi:hypothetical protein
MKHISLLFLMVMLSACYRAPEIENFDQERWENGLEECDGYREGPGIEALLKQEQILLTINQNQVEVLLGPPTRHELFRRNQKFFIYHLDCQGNEALRIRFDALGRAKELQKIKLQ